MTENSFVVLCMLERLGADCPINAVRCDEIEATDFKVESRSTVYKQLVRLVRLGYVAKGIKDGRNCTYYLTTKGKLYLKEA